MKNKAFTLIELLGVIVLLGILGVVIIPKVGDSITNGKETAYVTQEEQIKKAATDFIIDNIELLETTDTITIKLGVLKQKGYLPINIKNPKTRKNISNESLITITKEGNNYNIQVSLIDLENVTENIDDNSPIIALNGSYVEYVEVNSTYEEKGAKAQTSTGQRIDNVSIQIKQNNQEKTSIDTSQLLTYNVIYSATDTNGNTTSVTRTVIVRDSTSPTITYPTETILHVSEVADFNIMDGVSITDNHSTSPEITTNSSLASLPGNYVVTYTATDSSGNETTERRVINVNADFNKYYTNLEYLESSGTQYIDTGFIPNQDTSIEVDGYTNSNKSLYGTEKGINGTGVGPTGPTMGFYYFTDYTGRYNSDIAVNVRHTFKQEKNKLYVDNNLIHVFNETTSSSNYPIFLFGRSDSTNGSLNDYGPGRIYSVKIWNDDKLVRNMIPCLRKSDDEVGLYDLVNDIFYKNQGTGEFTAGNPIN